LRAEAVTLGVLTGTQSRERLRAADPADIITSVKELPDHMLGKDYV